MMKHAIVVLAIVGALLASPDQAGALTYLNSYSTFGGFTLSSPGGIAVNAEGELWIADRLNSRVLHVTNTGGFILKAGVSGTLPGQLTTDPGQLTTDYDVAVVPKLPGSEQDVWVTDYKSPSQSPIPSRLEKFDGDTGDYITGSIFGTYGTGNVQFKLPKGVFVDANGNIWVADSGNNRIQKFSSSGAFLMTFGSLGSSNGQFNQPSDVVVDASGNVWVADNGNNRIQEFTSAGVFIRRIGGGLSGNALGNGNGEFWLPTTLAFDASGNLWVADFNNNRIQEFDKTDNYNWELSFGTLGAGDGQFNKPYGVAVDPSGNIWVSDSGNNRIVELGEPVVIPEPVTMAGLALGLSCLTGYIRRRKTA